MGMPVMADVFVYHVIAWLLLVASYFMVPCFPVFLRRRSLIPVIWCLLTAHHAVAVINTFVFTVPLAGADARGFYLWAAYLSVDDPSGFGIGAPFYGNLLGMAFRVAGTSHLLAHQLSILAFLFSCAVLVRIVEYLGAGRHAAVVLWVYGLWPPFLILSSIPMREIYQTLFLMTAVLMGLKYHYAYPRRWRFLAGVAVAALAMGLFHRGLIVYALALIALLALWPIRGSGDAGGTPMRMKHKLAGLGLFLMIVAALVVLSTRYSVPGLNVFRMVATGEIVEYTADVRERAGGQEARTFYGAELDLTSPLRFTTSAGAILGNYLFAPWPHQVRKAMDLPVFMEAVVRMMLVVIICARWFRARDDERSVMTLLMAVYFSLAVVWALGTHNYGTAWRHNQTHNWLLFVLGIPVIMEWLHRKMGVPRIARSRRRSPA